MPPCRTCVGLRGIGGRARSRGVHWTAPPLLGFVGFTIPPFIGSLTSSFYFMTFNDLGVYVISILVVICRK